MKYLDRKKATQKQIAAAIGRAIETGETLTITEDGVPRVQIVRPQPVRCFCSVCEDEEEMSRMNACEGEVMAPGTPKPRPCSMCGVAYGPRCGSGCTAQPAPTQRTQAAKERTK